MTVLPADDNNCRRRRRRLDIQSACNIQSLLTSFDVKKSGCWLLNKQLFWAWHSTSDKRLTLLTLLLVNPSTTTTYSQSKQAELACSDELMGGEEKEEEVMWLIVCKWFMQRSSASSTAHWAVWSSLFLYKGKRSCKRGRVCLHMHFFSRFGILFRPNIVPLCSKKFGKIFDPVILLYWGTKFDPNKISSVWLSEIGFSCEMVKIGIIWKKSKSCFEAK